MEFFLLCISICQWFGVECNNDSNIIGIRLSFNKLFGTIPDSIGQLSSLQHLDLRFNQLSGSIPDSIGQLDILQILDLRSNQLYGTISDSIGRFGTLQS